MQLPIRSLLCPILILALGASAHADDRKPAAPPLSPLMKYKSQEDALHSASAVMNALGSLARGGPVVPESFVLSALEKNAGLARMLDQARETRYAASTNANQIAVLNSASGLSEVFEINYGACAGVTTLSWLANTLAAFDVEGQREFRAKGADPVRLGEIRDLVAKPMLTPEEKTKVLAFYRPYIDRLTAETKFTVVPFFPNAQAWTDHPALNAAFQWRAMELWFAKVSTFSGLLHMLSATNPKFYQLQYAEVTKFAKRVQAYLDHHVNPMVFITAGGRSYHARYIHVFQAWKVEALPATGQLIIHVLDPNYGGDRRHGKIIFSGISEEGRKDPKKVSAYFSDPQNWGPSHPLLEVDIAPWTPDMTVQAGLSLLEAAKKDPAGVELLAR